MPTFAYCISPQVYFLLQCISTPLMLFIFCVLLWLLLVPAALDLWPLSPHTYAWCLVHCITGPTCACCISLQVHSPPSKHFYLTHAACLLFVTMGLACVCGILLQVPSPFPAVHCMCAVCLLPLGILTPLALCIKHSQYTMFPFFSTTATNQGLLVTTESCIYPRRCLCKGTSLAVP